MRDICYEIVIVISVLIKIKNYIDSGSFHGAVSSVGIHAANSNSENAKGK